MRKEGSTRNKKSGGGEILRPLIISEENQMYPNPVFLGLTLYDICLCVGIILCFIVFGMLADKHKVKRELQSFAMMCGVGAVALGYGSAVLFQALYNIKSIGKFEITKSTGATFYGGLIGGVAVFLLLYFGIGYFKYENRRHVKAFWRISDSAVPGILIAHSIGRIGCLMAGCCHGGVTDAWCGIEMQGSAGLAKYVPTQLFEAVFLLLLFAFLLLRSLDKKGFCLPIYLCTYSVWRFFLEFARADYRGDTFVEFLSPSQLIAIILFAVGIGVFFLEGYTAKKLLAEASDEKSE